MGANIWGKGVYVDCMDTITEDNVTKAKTICDGFKERRNRAGVYYITPCPAPVTVNGVLGSETTSPRHGATFDGFEVRRNRGGYRQYNPLPCARDCP